MVRVFFLFFVLGVPGVFADESKDFFMDTCVDPAKMVNSIGKTNACWKGVSLESMPDVFSERVSGIKKDQLITQDNRASSYYSQSDFEMQLKRFIALDEKSRNSACYWLFWKNGVMRRPFSGTLCAIGRKQEFIKQVAKKHGVPPEFIACAIGGDSMINSLNPDDIAVQHSTKGKPLSNYVSNLVQKQARVDAEKAYQVRTGKSIIYEGTDATEKLIEKIALIGAEAKAKYLSVYWSRKDLEFGAGVGHEAALLATIYNKGVPQCNPTPDREPGFNYFGLSCARFIKIYQQHLDWNLSASDCTE